MSYTVLDGYLKKKLFFLFLCVLLSSCYNDQEQQEVMLLKLGEKLEACYELESNYLQLQNAFYVSTKKSIEVDAILKEISYFYKDTKSLRLDAQSCASELFDNYDDSEIILNSRKKVISILTNLGKYEAIIYTHMTRINADNVDDELWMLKKMLDYEAEYNQ